MPKLRIFTGGRMEGRLILGTKTKNVPDGYIKVWIADAVNADGSYVNKRVVVVSSHEYRGLVAPFLAR